MGSDRNGNKRGGPHRFGIGNKAAVGRSQPRMKGIRAEMRRMIEEGFEGKDVDTEVAKAILKYALKGSARHAEIFIDNTDGPVPTRIAGHDGGPLFKAYVGLDMRKALADDRRELEAGDDG